MSSKKKIVVLKKDREPSLVPKLRFPEFRGEPGWECEPLGELFETMTGGTPDRTKKEYWGGSIPWVTTSLVDFNVITNADEFITDTGLQNSSAKLFPKNTVLVALYGQGKTRGKVAQLGIEATTNQACAAILPGSKIHPQFTYANLCGRYSEMRALSNSGGQENLSQGLIREIPFHYPLHFAEQQKIAECLSSVDELIAAQARKVDALKTHKNGLIQHLFPREGETQPRLRFPEFQYAGEWEEVDFADAIFFQEGPGIMSVDFRDEGVPLVRLSGLAGQTVSLDGCNYLDPDKVEQKWSHFRLEAGDIVVSCSASFGRPATVSDVAVDAVFYTGLVRFKAKDDRICVSYLEVFLGSPSFLRQAQAFAVGGGIKHFGPSHLRQMKVPLPRVPEQRRIADCLTSLDDLIAAQTQKLEALKTHKKGLMQQLFPSLEETEA